MKKFVVILCKHNSWGQPIVSIISADNEIQAYDLFAVIHGFKDGELEECQDFREIVIIIKEC